MHDTVIAVKIIADVKKRTQGKKVIQVSLEVGELAPVEDHHIQETLALLSGWKVEAKETPSHVKCPCGFRGRPKIIERGHDFVLFSCPQCGAVPQIVKGDGIEVKDVQVE